MPLVKRGSTLFLKAIITLLGLAVLALCIFVLPAGIQHTHWWGYRPIFIGMYIPAIPFFIALFQGFKLLSYIDSNTAFSSQSIKALTIIKYCGFIIGALYALGMPYIFKVAQQDDAPGVVLIGLVFTFAPIAIAVFAEVIRKQMQNTINLKSENDLTV